MAENKEYITQQESAGAIQISEDVVASISSSVAHRHGGRTGDRGRQCHDGSHQR